MADIDSGLPIRSEADGTDERVHVKIVDGVANPAVNQTEVDADNNLHVEVHGNRADDAADVALLLSELGAAAVDGVYEADDNSNPSNIGLVAAVRAASPADADQTQRLTAKTGTTDTDVHALDVSLHDQNGNAFTAANPIPVSIVDAVAGATEVLDQTTHAAIAKAATSTHTYTITAGKTLVLQKIYASASGKIKVEVKLGTIASEVLKVVAFNSTASPNWEYQFATPQRMADTQDVVVIVTNLDVSGAQDIYTTIEGYEV